MDSSQLFGITTLLFLFSSIFYVGLLVFKNDQVGKIGFYLAFLGLLVCTAGIGLRWYESYAMGIGRAPLINMFESLVFFAWSIAFFYVFVEIKFKVRVIGAFVMPLALIAIAYASFGWGMHQQIKPLIPALQSNWLIAHVVTCFIGYAGFTVAFALGFMYLIKERAIIREKMRSEQEKQKTGDNSHQNYLPSLKIIDDLTNKSIVFGFIWLTAGIITGSIWANEAWGTYWSWDPKETWSIITWFIYALAIHLRFTRGWSGKRIAWLAILGFFSVLFTYFGVNYLLSGLHSYA
jgi:cytochrome c-type biogenesis protein CcsB